MRNQGLLFLGMFLITFGLYAAQLKKKQPVQPETKIAAVASSSVPLKQTRIQNLYEQVAANTFFSNKINGIRLFPAQAPIQNSFLINFYGDEVFIDESVSIHESWNSALDLLAKIITSEPGLMVEISGFADLDHPLEKSTNDEGSSAYAFSFSRAESLAHYFERKHGISIQKNLVLKGMGAVSQGRKIELKFYFDSSAESNNSGAE